MKDYTEQRVFMLACLGKTPAEIADAVNLPEDFVSGYYNTAILRGYEQYTAGQPKPKRLTHRQQAEIFKKQLSASKEAFLLPETKEKHNAQKA